VKDTAKIMIISLFANLALQNNVIFMFFIITNRRKSRVGDPVPHERIVSFSVNSLEFQMQMEDGMVLNKLFDEIS